MKSLTKATIKHCRKCNTDKPLSDFRVRIKPTGPSYGHCNLCERKYDHTRRRAKGVPMSMTKKVKKSTLPKAALTPVQQSYAHYIKNRPSTPTHTKVCRECSAPYKGYQSSVFCNAKCSNRYHNRIRRKKERARLRQAKVESVDPIVVFTRHGWTCACCDTCTPRHLLGKHKPDSPELDHIVPLSRGGAHSYANTQLLCRLCNSLKSNNIVNNNTELSVAIGP